MPSSSRPRKTQAGRTHLAAAAVALLLTSSCSGSASDGGAGGSATTSNPATSAPGTAPCSSMRSPIDNSCPMMPKAGAVVIFNRRSQSAG